MKKTGMHARAALCVLHMKQLPGQLRRAVIRSNPAQVATLRTAGAVRQLGGELCKTPATHAFVREFQQGTFGMHRQCLDIDPRRDGKQDVPHMQGLAHHKLRLVCVVVTLAFCGGRRGAGHVLVHHRLDDQALGLGQLRCGCGRVVGQQALAHRLLAQQLGVGQLAQCIGVR